MFFFKKTLASTVKTDYTQQGNKLNFFNEEGGQ